MFIYLKCHLLRISLLANAIFENMKLNWLDFLNYYIFSINKHISQVSFQARLKNFSSETLTFYRQLLKNTLLEYFVLNLSEKMRDKLR